MLTEKDWDYNKQSISKMFFVDLIFV